MKKDKNIKPLPVAGKRSDIAKFNSEREKKAAKKKIGFDLGYLFSAFLTIGVAILSVGLVVYFGYHLINLFTSDITYTTAYTVTETEYRRGTGYIFRDETIILKPTAGVPDYAVDDGERLGIGEKICTLYSSINDDASARIEEIENRLSLLRASLGSGVIKEGIPEALRDSNERYDEIMSFLAAGDYSAAARLSGGFLSSLIRLELLGEGSDAVDLEIKSLEAEKAMLLSTYGKATGSVRAESVGYFFSDADGYESIFDPSLLSEITVGGFAELIGREPGDASRAVGKMANEAKWYLAITFDAADAEGFVEGKSYDIVFHDNDSRTLTMKLERLVLDLDDYDKDDDRAEALLIFSTVKMPDNFRYLRAQNVSVAAASFKGYRIPITAVRSYDGMTGVYIVAGGYVLFRQIDVIHEKDGYCIAAAYSDAEPGKPLTYTSLGFERLCLIDGMIATDEVAEELGWEKTRHDNGGIPVPKGQTLRYFYHLNDLEEIILTGKDLYHGKALD